MTSGVDATRGQRLALGASRLVLPVMAVALLGLLWHRHAVSARGDAAPRVLLWTGSTIQRGWVSATTRDGQLSSLVGVVATRCPDWRWFRLGWPSGRWRTSRSGSQISATQDAHAVRDEARQFTARLQTTFTLTIDRDVRGTLSVLAPLSSDAERSPCQTSTQSFTLRRVRD
jgi:hypothetical protein